MGRKNSCREGVGESQDRDGSGDREEWLGGDCGGYSLLNGSNSLFFGIVPSILGECPPHTLRTLQESGFVFILVEIEKNETMHS